MLSGKLFSMRINKVTFSSTCKDGSLVKEYILNSPVTHQDLSRLTEIGEMVLKDLGGTELFTLSSDLLTMKGMIDDTVVYITHRKENGDEVELLMNQIFG